MNPYAPDAIRNILLAGHQGSGKTSLAEALLFASAATTRMGSVEDGNTVTDFEPEETKRGNSVSLAMAPVEWEGVKLNVLDTPGYSDFLGDVKAALRATDLCLLVVSAVEGVEVQHEVVWELAVEAGVPRAFFVNKLDRERASFDRTFDGLVQAFGTQVAPVQFPIGEEHDFEGIVDLLSRRAHRYPSGPKGEEGEWPDDIAGKADPQREKLTEAVAEADDALLERYLERGELDPQDIVRGVKAGLAEGKIAPVLCGAATKPIGVDRLARFAIDAFPAPTDRPAVTVQSGGKDESLPPDPSGPLAAFVFKTISDPYVGRINLFRVYSGTLRPDSTVRNEARGSDERVGQLFTMKGKDHENLAAVAAGDIGAVAKLAHTATGDTLSSKDHPLTLPPLDWPEPLYEVAIEPKTQGDEDKLSTALSRIGDEDPTVRVDRRPETRQTVLVGMGESHLDVLTDRMKRKHGVDVVTAPARIPYKETIRGRADAQGRYVKQTGGHGQFGVCHIIADPKGRGEGFEFENKIVGGVIPSGLIPSVEKGIVKAMEQGVTTPFPMVDVKVTLDDGKHHPVDSSDMAFQIAGSLAIKEAAEKAGTVLLEPIVDVEVVVPESYTGDVIGDLNAKRGRVLGMDPTGAGKTTVRAQIPQAELTRFPIELRSMTGGRGLYTMRFSHYEEVPPHIADKVVAEAKQEREESK